MPTLHQQSLSLCHYALPDEDDDQSVEDAWLGNMAETSIGRNQQKESKDVKCTDVTAALLLPSSSAS